MNLNEYRRTVVLTVACPISGCGAGMGELCQLPALAGRSAPVEYVHDDRSWAFHSQAYPEPVFAELEVAQPQKIININVRVETQDDLDTISKWVKSL